MSNRYFKRIQVVDGLDELVRNQIAEGKEPYFVNFMFQRLSGGDTARAAQMAKDVTRFHGLLTQHVVRRPDAPSWSHLRPALIGVPDLPVSRRQKTSSRLAQVNAGLHFNAVILMPPRRRDDHPDRPKRSRLRTCLRAHVDLNFQKYRTSHLYRMHVTAIETGTMVDYAFKTYAAGRVSHDSILILK